MVQSPEIQSDLYVCLFNERQTSVPLDVILWLWRVNYGQLGQVTLNSRTVYTIDLVFLPETHREGFQAGFQLAPTFTGHRICFFILYHSSASTLWQPARTKERSTLCFAKEAAFHSQWAGKAPPENKNSFTYPDLDGNSKRVHCSLK